MDETAFPQVTFKLMGQEYCVSSQVVISIMVLDGVSHLPDSPAYMNGIIQFQGRATGILDLRILFGISPLAQELDDFGLMKDKHLEWVAELKKSVEEGRPFLLTTNPHKCKFGLWYDSFQTDNDSLNFILRQIAAPHETLHHCAIEIAACGRENKEETARLLQKAEEICNRQVLPLLDKLVENYREINKGIVIFLEQQDQVLGMLVDEVTGIFTPNVDLAYPPILPRHFIKNFFESSSGPIPQIDPLVLFGQELSHQKLSL